MREIGAKLERKHNRKQERRRGAEVRDTGNEGRRA